MNMRRVSLAAAAAAVLCVGGGYLFVAMGCGDDKPVPSKVEAPAPKAPVPSPATEVKAPASEVPKPAPEVAKAPEAAKVDENVPFTPVNFKEGATITGNVKVKEPIKRKKIRMTADPKCEALHAEPPLTEDCVVDANNNAQWVFVYVKKGLEGKKFEAPKADVLLDQKGCHYEPHVVGIMAGQNLLIRNSDDLLHNIHPVPFANKEFNEAQPQKGMETRKQFGQQEVMIKVGCNIHPWMLAWIGVLDHPFYSVTDATGKFEIKGLPPGKYTILAWHEKYLDVTADVEVKAGDSKTLNFEMTNKRE